ncbi:Signal transduction histidine kinase [Natronoarchaeum philippinense]|uniref:histidine kinase n=1 Tax=Natronoarchaeum philippinense TaxID=558529 RepID=A0A285P2X3_NATPI|nr:ATP-binding protein [Natronoarchaeum philippinense]SNZ16094.1 Signal transduction histidine kinase [Natronoarchaeum philippinense]
MSLFGADPLLVAYVVAFGGTGLLCFISIPRTRQITDPDTRRGLVSLLVLCGGWSVSHVGYLLVPMRSARLVFFVIGLSTGLAAVGAWLYFCSAYTGRMLHRMPSIRRAAVAVFAGIVLVKLTNPIHGIYYTATWQTTPFRYLAIEPGLAHWLAMALAYALSFVGYFMLIERFLQVDYDAKPFIALVTLTGLPAIADVLGVTSPLLLNTTYEPIGVAAFAVGILFFYLDGFQNIQLAGNDDEPVVYLNEERTVRESNQQARTLFPELVDATGRPIEDVLPDVADRLDDDGETILERTQGDSTRYYQVSASPFTAGEVQIGELLRIEDVTEAERYRRELERETERLNAFASMVAHDLRNPLNVAQGYVDIEREREDREELEAIDESLDRMDDIIEDVLTLAREGEDIGDTEPVSLAATVEQCWQGVDTAAATLAVEDDLQVIADESRLRQLIENLLRNAVEHGGSDVTITVGELDGSSGFYVEDDGDGIPAESRERVLEAGFTSSEDGTGFGLEIVKKIANAHGWAVTVTESDDGGARFEFDGIEWAPRVPES